MEMNLVDQTVPRGPGECHQNTTFRNESGNYGAMPRSILQLPDTAGVTHLEQCESIEHNADHENTQTEEVSGHSGSIYGYSRNRGMDNDQTQWTMNLGAPVNLELAPQSTTHIESHRSIILVARDQHCCNTYRNVVGFNSRLFLLLIILILERGTPVKTSVMEWTATPGDIMVLSNTAARFQWAHTIIGPVNIAWYYKGTRAAPALEYIMGFSNNEVYLPINGGRHLRLEYDEDPGSATMTLNNVTAEDQGIYEVKVVDLAGAPASVQYIVDIMELTVIEESSISLRARVEQETIYQSLELNGTKLTLPTGELLVPTRISAGVNVSSTAPVPSAISVGLSVGQHVYQELDCDHTITCYRLVPVFQHYIAAHGTVATLTVVTTFPVQNLAPLEVIQEFLLLKYGEPTWHTTPGNITVLANTLARFYWTHSIVESVYITWNYKSASENSTSENILLYSDNKTYHTGKVERYLRLTYKDFPGSAAVIIDNVTEADDGVYGVHVLDLAPTNDWFPGRKGYLSDSAVLDVIEESEIKFSISLDGQTFTASCDQNGTRMVLPREVVEVPIRLEIFVHIAELAPTARSISIGLDTGVQLKSEAICKDTQHCHSHVSFGEKYDATTGKEVKLVIIIDFPIENLPPIEINKTYTLLEYCASCISTPGTIAVLAGTRATFHWIHSFDGEPQITWSYKGTRTNPTSESVLMFTGNRTVVPETTGYKGITRARYDGRPGSAVLILDDVSEADAGFYEVDVVSYSNTSARGQLARDTAILRVIREDDIYVSGRVDEEQFNLLYIFNGPTSTLPKGTVTVPTRLDVTVETAHNGPVPNITISLRTGNKTNEEPICEDYVVCERNVPVFAPDMNVPDVEIIIELIIVATFPVQNLPQITVRKTFVLFDPKGNQVPLKMRLQEFGNGPSMVNSEMAYSGTSMFQSGAAMFIFGILLVFVTVRDPFYSA